MAARLALPARAGKSGIEAHRAAWWLPIGLGMAAWLALLPSLWVRDGFSGTAGTACDGRSARDPVTGRPLAGPRRAGAPRTACAGAPAAEAGR